MQAVWDIQKALELGVDRAESVVKDKESAKWLRNASQMSPIKDNNLEKVKIRLISTYL